MVAFFISKNKLLSGVAHYSTISNRWAPRWLILHNSSRTSNSGATKSGYPNSNQFSRNLTNGEQQGYNKKGKLNKIQKNRKSWGWKAGAGAGWTILSVLDWWLIAASGWLTWRGIFLKWTPLGICIFAAVQWHLVNEECDKKGLPRTASQWQTNVYCSLPLRLVSRSWGWIADCRVPIPIRPIVYGCYSTAFGVNLNEAASSDLKNYRSLAEFFARSLKENARLIDAESCLVSPADGKVLHFGLATDEQIEQVKGVTYSLKSFLGPANWAAQQSSKYVDNIKLKPQDSELYQCVIYLAPGDYHRFHSPTTWTPELRRHFAGELLSVSPKVAKWLPGLFCLNERALYIGKWSHGFFSFTAVGATNVGSVQIYIDEQLQTNKWSGFKVGKHNTNEVYEEIELPKDTLLCKGELLGQFNMGSTVVLIFEAPKHFSFSIEQGQKIKMGEPLGCIKDIKDDGTQVKKLLKAETKTLIASF